MSLFTSNTAKSLPTDSINLDHVPFKHSLSNLHLETQVKKQIVEKIQVIPTVESLKHNIELTKYICNMIEEGLNKQKGKKIDKKALAFDVLSVLFELTEEDKKMYDGQIEFLHINKMIKCVKTIKKVSSFVASLVQKKFL